MAHPTIELISGLREAAYRLRQGAFYAWGHHGGCNCGHLVQVVCSLNKDEVLSRAQQVPGEWTEIAEESCSVTHLPLSEILQRLEQIGLTPSDIHHLEYLSDRRVLEQLPGGFRWLKKNCKEDVVLYFEAMAALLEEAWLRTEDFSMELLEPASSEVAFLST